MALRSVVCPVVVGRDEEIAALEAAGATVGPGGGRTLLIGGEAGVGKSRLAGEAQHIAARLGMRVLVGGCAEVGGTAYAPFVTALRRHTRSLDEAELTALFSGPALLSATLVPEVAGALGLTGLDAGRDDLHAAMWHLLHRIGAQRPVLLCLEDVHWAAVDTLQLLQHLATEAPSLPLWLVATFRTDELHRRHPLTASLTALRRSDGVDELLLRPLDREDQRSMLSALFAGTEVGDEFLDAVRGRTEGNPFFIEELAATLVERGDIFQAQGDWNRRTLDEIEMPLTVRETLLSRVARLEGEAQDILRVAAVAGEHIDPAVLAVATGAGPDGVDTALVAALERQLLVERRSAASVSYAFRHALLREALADDLVGPERRQAHARVAAALEAVHAADLDAVAVPLALHWEEAGNRESALEARLRAARRAVADLATTSAVEHYNAALRLVADDARRLEVLLEAARNVYRDDQRAEAVGFAQEARRLAQRAGDRTAEAAALRTISQEHWGKGDGNGAIALIEEAVRLTAGETNPVAAIVRSQLARLLALTGSRAEEGRALLPDAERVAREAGAGEALASVYGTRAILATEEDSDAATEEAIRVSREAGALFQECNAWGNGGYTALWRGALRTALDRFRHAVELTERVNPGRLLYVRAGRAWACSLAGLLDEAWSTGIALDETRDVPAGMVALTATTEVALVRGDLDEARRRAEANRELAVRSGESQRLDPADSHLWRVRIAADGPSSAAEPADRISAGRWLSLQHLGCHALVSPDLARALRQTGESRRLLRMTGALAELTARDPTPHNRAAQRFVDAELALAEGRAQDAAAAFKEAAEGYAAMPCPQREIQALLGVGEAALSAGDVDGTRIAAEAAMAAAGRLGAPILLEEATALRSRSDADQVLATVLVTDIVGSTERAAAVGDRAWRALLERHHTLVRRLLEEHRGREIDTAGDGFLAAFDSPARAIRCALAVTAELQGVGIPVRAGVHTGECAVLGGKLAGIAVHTAARVAAMAAAGEVLVTATVRDLVAGASFRYQDRGSHTLRGVPDQWHLFAVADPEATAAR